MRNKRLQWAEHDWRNQNPLIHIIQEENLIGKDHV